MDFLIKSNAFNDYIDHWCECGLSDGEKDAEGNVRITTNGLCNLCGKTVKSY